MVFIVDFKDFFVDEMGEVSTLKGLFQAQGN